LEVGILAGRGDQGRGLAYRLARAVRAVLVGSRYAVEGESVATDLSTMPGVAAPVTGGENRWAAEGADLVIVAVPWDGHAATLADLRGPLAGKVVVDCVNPLGFDARGPYAVSVPDGSAREQAAALLPDSRVGTPVRPGRGAPARLPGVRRVPPRQRGAARRPDGQPDRPGRAGARRRPRGGRHGPGARRPHPRRTGRLCRTTAQRPPGGGAHRQPHRHQPSLPHPRRDPGHHPGRGPARTCARSGTHLGGGLAGP